MARKLWSKDIPLKENEISFLALICQLALLISLHQARQMKLPHPLVIIASYQKQKVSPDQIETCTKLFHGA